MKVFISQPMRGKSREEIMAVREKAIESVTKHFGETPEIIGTYIEDSIGDASPLLCLARSIELLSYADVAYFAKGWEEARGCRIENACAIEYGIDVIEDYSK